jgi:L-fuconolactonase
VPDYPIVDSHVHLCQPGRFGYAWTKGQPSLNREVLPSDLTKAAAPVEIDQFVFVEVDVDFPQHLDEAAWVAEQANVDPRLTGMVAALPLERGAAIEPELDQLRQHRILRAIRRLIQTQPDPDFCLQPDFLAGLRLLPQHDLAFDICVLHHQLPNVIEMVRQCPEVRFVLDHIGKPGIKAGIFDPWRRQLKELAALPNVHCKISGVTTEADHGNWTRAQLKPYIAHTIETFGFDRVMYGGDWHVLELAGTYLQWVEIVDWVVEGCTAEEKCKLFRDNAISFYRLNG